ASIAYSAFWTSAAITCCRSEAYCVDPAFGKARPWFRKAIRLSAIARSSSFFVMCWLPTTATSPLASLAEDAPPQAATSSTKGSTKTRERSLMGMRTSCRLTRGQHSIEQSDRPGELAVAERHLAPRARVDGGVDASAKLAQLGRAEHDRPHRRASAASFSFAAWIANRFSTGSGSGP